MALMNKQMKNTCKMIESSFLKVSMSKKRNHEHLVFENFKKYYLQFLSSESLNS